jgi:hypothetical protein
MAGLGRFGDFEGVGDLEGLELLEVFFLIMLTVKFVISLV